MDQSPVRHRATGNKQTHLTFEAMDNQLFETLATFSTFNLHLFCSLFFLGLKLKIKKNLTNEGKLKY